MSAAETVGVIQDRFSDEAQRLLMRSSGYLAVGWARDGQLLNWEVASSLSGQPESDQIRAHVHETLAPIKLLVQTLPSRAGHVEPLSIRLQYQTDRDKKARVGYLCIYIQDAEVLILVTRESELVERAQFWIQQHGAKLISREV